MSQSRNRLRKLGPIAAYLVLAFAVAFSFDIERSHSNENRASLANSTHIVLVQGCERGNDLRRTLQKLILDGIPTVHQYVKAGTISPEQGRLAIIQAHRSANKIKPLDCQSFYNLNEPNPSP